MFGFSSVTSVNLGAGYDREFVCGTHNGDLLYYRGSSELIEFDESKLIVDRDFIAHRHPTIWAMVTAYPNPETGLSDLIVGGEAGFYYYSFSGEFNQQGAPIYDDQSLYCRSRRCFVMPKPLSLRSRRQERPIYNADSTTLMSSLLAGGAGYSGVMANFHPDLYVWLCAKYHMQLNGINIALYNRVSQGSLSDRTRLQVEQLYSFIQGFSDLLDNHEGID